MLVWIGLGGVNHRMWGEGGAKLKRLKVVQKIGVGGYNVHKYAYIMFSFELTVYS